MNPYTQQLLSQLSIGERTWIAPNATVLGRVTLGSEVSVWYQAVLRADHDTITIGNRTNVQDGVIMHVDPHKPITIGNNVLIGHGAIIHGATIGDACLIGMRATIMNNARIGKGCIVGAHALVTEGMVVPDYSMVLGAPAKVTKTLPPEIIDRIERGVQAYVDEAAKYLAFSV